MTKYYSTRQAAIKIGVKPDTLNKAIWQNRVTSPPKSPSGCYLWTVDDINRASWALLHRAYQPEDNDEC